MKAMLWVCKGSDQQVKDIHISSFHCLKGISFLYNTMICQLAEKPSLFCLAIRGHKQQLHTNSDDFMARVVKEMRFQRP